MAWQREGLTVIKDAIEVIHFCILVVHLLSGEETGGGHLFVIADNNKCLAATDGTYGFGRGHLGRFVEDDKVELRLIEIYELSHTDGTH